MTGFNYAPSPLAALTPLRAALGGRAARGPALAIAAVALLFAFTWTVQALRLRAIDDRAAAIAARSASIQPALRRLRAAQGEVARLESRAAAHATMRASGSREANAVAIVGNALPAGTWITSLRLTGRGVALEGRTSHIAAVADAMSALARTRGVARVRLLSVHADPTRPLVTYALAVDRTP